ncbi:MAG TPA: hypothetical protein EYP53_04455 [Candidatus Latescibacteria bacterium]|nr:hypothetical protein [Candidatus Latescibacterota bacterium]
MSPDVQVEKPQLKTPVSLIVDDSSPGEPIYSDFVDAFAVLVQETRIKGKFTVMPYTSPETLSDALKGKRPLAIERLIKKIRQHIAPNFDITPEILTHNPVADLETGGFVYPCVPEHVWSQSQTAQTLTPYIARALRILRDAGMEAWGVTSPANFGIDVETEYAEAVLRAQQQINHRSLTWYFLHTDVATSRILPKLAFVDMARREAVVSIVSGYGDYVVRPELRERPMEEKVSGYADQYLTTDGRQGRLADLYRADSYLIFHHHWWRMLWDDGAGFKILREVVRRLDEIFGQGIQWMKIGEIALYWAAAQWLEVEVKETKVGMGLKFRSPFQCPNFTVSFEMAVDPRRLLIRRQSQEFARQESVELSGPHVWCMKDGRVYLCFDLDFETEIEVRIIGHNPGD